MGVNAHYFKCLKVIMEPLTHKRIQNDQNGNEMKRFEMYAHLLLSNFQKNKLFFKHKKLKSVNL